MGVWSFRRYIRWSHKFTRGQLVANSFRETEGVPYLYIYIYAREYIIMLYHDDNLLIALDSPSR